MVPAPPDFGENDVTPGGVTGFTMASVKVAVVLPLLLDPLIVYVLGAENAIGVPLIAPVELLKLKPEGSVAGPIKYPEACSFFIVLA